MSYWSADARSTPGTARESTRTPTPCELILGEDSLTVFLQPVCAVAFFDICVHVKIPGTVSHTIDWAQGTQRTLSRCSKTECGYASGREIATQRPHTQFIHRKTGAPQKELH